MKIVAAFDFLKKNLLLWSWRADRSAPSFRAPCARLRQGSDFLMIALDWRKLDYQDLNQDAKCDAKLIARDCYGCLFRSRPAEKSLRQKKPGKELTT